jgi:hypothetical protein
VLHWARKANTTVKREPRKNKRKRKKILQPKEKGNQGRREKDTNKPELPKGKVRAPAYASLRDSIRLGLG